MQVLVLTGFEAFAEHERNPSGEIARALHGSVFGDCRVASVVLPVARRAMYTGLAEAIERWRPAIVVATGVSSRQQYSVERRAVNLDDYVIPDVAGDQPRQQAIDPDPGVPQSLQTTVDVDDLVGAMRRATPGVAIEPSNDAGTFCCNHLYYRLLRSSVGGGGRHAFRGVFIHLPTDAEACVLRGAVEHLARQGSTPAAPRADHSSAL